MIHASPGWLALAVYGRVRVDSPAFDITDPADTPDRFAAVFGPFQEGDEKYADIP